MQRALAHVQSPPPPAPSLFVVTYSLGVHNVDSSVEVDRWTVNASKLW